MVTSAMKRSVSFMTALLLLMPTTGGCRVAPETQTPVSYTTPIPREGPLEQTMPGELSGMITGLDEGATVILRLEFRHTGGIGSIRDKWARRLPTLYPWLKRPVKRFLVANGHWQSTDLVTEPGHYRLVPESDEYVSIPGKRGFLLPEANVAWRHTYLSFEFLHPEDAPDRLGVALCSKGAPRNYVIPESSAPPTPTPTYGWREAYPGTRAPKPSWPPGTCYAGHLREVHTFEDGMVGQVSGLPAGQMATIRIYVLRLKPNEVYWYGAPAMEDMIYPPERKPLQEAPQVLATWPLTATVTVGNGLWGILDPALTRRKYLVIAEAEGQTAIPPAYEVMVAMDRELPDLAHGVDFAFGETSQAPTD